MNLSIDEVFDVPLDEEEPQLAQQDAHHNEGPSLEKGQRRYIDIDEYMGINETEQQEIEKLSRMYAETGLPESDFCPLNMYGPKTKNGPGMRNVLKYIGKNYQLKNRMEVAWHLFEIYKNEVYDNAMTRGERHVKMLTPVQAYMYLKNMRDSEAILERIQQEIETESKFFRKKMVYVDHKGATRIDKDMYASLASNRRFLLQLLRVDSRKLRKYVSPEDGGLNPATVSSKVHPSTMYDWGTVVNEEEAGSGSDSDMDYG